MDYYSSNVGKGGKLHCIDFFISSLLRYQYEFMAFMYLTTSQLITAFYLLSTKKRRITHKSFESAVWLPNITAATNLVVQL